MSVVPRLVTRNWRLKLAATGLAVFLWAVVRTAPDSTTATVPARVEVDMTGSPGWTPASPPDPSQVAVDVRGSFGEIERIRRTGLSFRIPLDQVSGGDTVVTLRPGWATLDGGLSVERIDPARVRLAFEESDSAARPISLRPVGELPEDLALAQPISLTPVVVRVRGPTSLVERVDSIPTVGPDLSQIEESDVYEVPLDTTGFPGLTFATTTASVGIRLEPAVDSQFEAVPVMIADTTGEVPVSELALDPPLVEVTLRGGRTRVSQARVPDLLAEVDAVYVQTMQPGEVRTVPLRVTGVPDLVEATARPDSVTVRRRGGEEEVEGGGLRDPGAEP